MSAREGMDERTVRALLEIKEELGEEMLTDFFRVKAFLADLLVGRRGERHLLLQLLEGGLPRQMASGRFTEDGELAGLARYWSGVLLSDGRATHRAVRIWRYVVDADVSSRPGPLDMAAILGPAGVEFEEDVPAAAEPAFDQGGGAAERVVSADAAPPEVVECPLCGKYNPKTETFRCRGCGTARLCLRH